MGHESSYDWHYSNRLITAPTFGQYANAQRPDERSKERARIIQKCMAINKKYNNDPYLPNGGVEHMYRACMAAHSQMP
jgi:hypothetical protein